LTRLGGIFVTGTLPKKTSRAADVHRERRESTREGSTTLYECRDCNGANLASSEVSSGVSTESAIYYTPEGLNLMPRAPVRVVTSGKLFTFRLRPLTSFMKTAPRLALVPPPESREITARGWPTRSLAFH
jgi:hypothetical protein